VTAEADYQLNKSITRKESFMRIQIRLSVIALMMAVFIGAISAQPAMAGSAAQIDRDVDNALKKLYAKSPAALKLSKVAKGILVFPKITKGGLIIGGQYGEGALRINDKTAGYYNTAAASYGLQAGGQQFAYALFFMDSASLEYLTKSDGWEVGVGPSIVAVDEGMAKTLTSSTAREGIYAFIYGQKGLMAGLGIQGSKITRITP
jgi:lipid-binding SYLF domain-containing protein